MRGKILILMMGVFSLLLPVNTSAISEFTQTSSKSSNEKNLMEEVSFFTNLGNFYQVSR